MAKRKSGSTDLSDAGDRKKGDRYTRCPQEMFEALAESLRHFADKSAEVAKRMEEQKLEAVMCPYWSVSSIGLDALQKFLATAEMETATRTPTKIRQFMNIPPSLEERQAKRRG